MDNPDIDQQGSVSDSSQEDGLLRDAKEFAVLATHYDGLQQYKTALFYYVVSGCQILYRLWKL